MKPYYQDSHVTIYHGDCREYVYSLAPFPLVCTDPPYGNCTDYDSYDDSETNLRSLVTGVITDLVGLSSRMAITPGVANIRLYPRPAWTLSWVTPAGCGSGPWGFCCWQPILVYGKCPYLEAGQGRRSDIILHTESSERNGHPCPKPLRLWKSVIKRVSADSMCPIVDPFMGSGTTLRAAKDMGRKAIGIELSERYCEIAAERMAQEVLFGVPEEHGSENNSVQQPQASSPTQVELDL